MLIRKIMSKDLHNNLDDFFRNSLNQYGEDPPDELWVELEKKIAVKPRRLDAIKKYSKHLILASTIASILSIFYLLYTKINNISEQLDQNTKLIFSLKIENDSLKYMIKNKQVDTIYMTQIVNKNYYIDNKNPDSKVADNKIADNKVADNKVVDNKVADNKIVDNKVADNKVADNKVVDNKVAEQTDIQLLGKSDSLFNYLADLDSTKIVSAELIKSDSTININEDIKFKEVTASNKKTNKRHASHKFNLFAWLKINKAADATKENKDISNDADAKIVANNNLIPDSKEAKSDKETTKTDIKEEKNFAKKESKSEKEFTEFEKSILKNRFSVGFQSSNIFNNNKKRIQQQNIHFPNADKNIRHLSYENAVTGSVIISSRIEIFTAVNYVVSKDITNNFVELNSRYDSLSNPHSELVITKYEVNISNMYGNSVAIFDIAQHRNSDFNQKINANIITQLQTQEISIPLIIKYRLIKNKIGVTLNAGVESSFLINKHESLIDVHVKNMGYFVGKQALISSPMFMKTNYSYSLGFDTYYRLQKMNFYITPSFKQALNNFNIDNSLIFKPYRFSIAAGMQIYF